MKINTHSWHYIVLRTMWETSGVPSNLCAYFWKLMLSLVLIVFAVSLGFVAFMLLTYPVWLHFVPSGVDYALAFGSALFWIILGSSVLIIYRDEAEYFYEESGHSIWHKPLTAPAKARNNILVAYIRAVKDKVCPRLEFTDEPD